MMAGILLSISMLSASPYTDLFQEAARAYDAGDYAAAIAKYEQLVREDVVSPAVFYNLGNAYYKAGRIGPAIANYERALHLAPEHQAAQENLAKALQETRRNLARPRPPEWEASLLFWHYGLTYGTALAVAIAAWWLFWILLATRLWKRVRYVHAVAVVAALLAVAFSVSAWSKAHPELLAVASEPTVVVRYVPETDGAARFELYEGDRVRVVETRSEWYSVETATGERGWAPSDAMTLVGPPYLPFAGASGDAAAQPARAESGGQ